MQSISKLLPCSGRSLLGFILALLLFNTFPLASSGEEPPFVLPPMKELMKLRSAVIRTNRGELFFELYPREAPWHVANFKYLADQGFYRGTQFHIFEPGYIIQGGGQVQNPSRGPGYTLPPEFQNLHKHVKGALGMARMADRKNVERRSDGSQFHILLRDSPHMDGSFTVFGKLIAGMAVLSELKRGDSIEEVTVYVRP